VASAVIAAAVAAAGTGTASATTDAFQPADLTANAGRSRPLRRVSAA
jgi:hypothetical protein